MSDFLIQVEAAFAGVCIGGALLALREAVLRWRSSV